MPRPQKKRVVCMEPSHFLFGPLGLDASEAKLINLTVDELECLRLIDLLGQKQEEVATMMNVARTTVQRIYEEARMKVAKMLVEGFYLQVSGGNYQLCEEEHCLYCDRPFHNKSSNYMETKKLE